MAKLMGLARIHRWSWKASLAGGTGFRAASDRMMLLGLGSAFAGPGFAGFWGMNRYGFWVVFRGAHVYVDAPGLISSVVGCMDIF